MHPHELHQIWQMGGGAGVSNKELIQKLKNRRSKLMFDAADRITELDFAVKIYKREMAKLESALIRIRDHDHNGCPQDVATEALE